MVEHYDDTFLYDVVMWVCRRWESGQKDDKERCCMPGRTSLNTGIFPTLLQRGGKDWMLGYTRKMITISTDGKTIQIE